MYCLGVAYDSAFGVIDDHTLLKTLFSHKNIPFFIQPEIGRFYPLDGQELNILSALFGLSANVFYTFNAICVAVVVFALRYGFNVILLEIVHTYGLNNERPSIAVRKIPYVVDILLILLLLSPAFITSQLRLFVPERMEFVFLSLFLMCYAYVLSKPRGFWSYFALVCGIVCANISMYYKETTFAFLCAFGFVHLVGAYISKAPCKWEIKIFDCALVLGAMAWFVLYVCLILLPKTSQGFYGESYYGAALVFAKAIFTNMCSEPFLYGATFGALVYRIYALLFKKQPFNALLDASIVGCGVLLLEYAILKIVSYHYLLPAYIFGCIVLGACVLLYWTNGYIRVVVLCCGLMFVGNSIFTSAYVWAHYKFVPQNFQATLAFVSAYTQAKAGTRIYIEGVDRVANVEVYHSFYEWLKAYGARDFDLLSDRAVDSRAKGRDNKEAKISVFQNDVAIPKQSGDLVILTPYSQEPFNLEGYKQKYELLFSAEYGYNVAHLGLKTFIKLALLKAGLAQGDTILSHNAFGLPLHFYVFRVK